MTETELSKKLCRALNERARTVIFKVHGHAMQRQGWPDLYLSCPQWRGWLETKAANGKLNHYQKLVIAELLDAGDRVHVLRFVTDKHFVIESLDGTVEASFGFSTWPEAAETLVIALFGIEAKSKC